MQSERRGPRVLGLASVAILCAGVGTAQLPSEPSPLPTTTQAPSQFGTLKYTITTISALSFSGESYIPVAPLSRTGRINVIQHFYAMLEVPSGVIIDYLGLNNFNDGTPGVISVTLWRRTILGATPFLGSVSNSPHASWATDENSTPAGIETDSQPLILDVAIAASPNNQYFGFVEARWRRTVSPAPAIASFTDVPTTYVFFQAIEALFAAGITAGCQANPLRYCPDSPVTRAQMAVFLAKALGL